MVRCDRERKKDPEERTSEAMVVYPPQTSVQACGYYDIDPADGRNRVYFCDRI